LNESREFINKMSDKRDRIRPIALSERLDSGGTAFRALHALMRPNENKMSDGGRERALLLS
jgi:hypothetical protein